LDSSLLTSSLSLLELDESPVAAINKCTERNLYKTKSHHSFPILNDYKAASDFSLYVYSTEDKKDYKIWLRSKMLLTSSN